MNQELVEKYRPVVFETVIGQDDVCPALLGFVVKEKVPQAILLHGPSGCGKTTIARILALHLEVELGNASRNYKELNAADTKGIDTIRDIRRYMKFKALGGGNRVWVIDEAHKLTNDAQNAFLKVLEDPPSHAYFILCTTDPGKLLPTVKGRCSTFGLKAVSPKVMQDHLKRICKAEKFKIGDEVLSKIIETSDGSPRKSLKLLEQVSQLPDDEQRLRFVDASERSQEAIELARLLLKPGGKWPEVAKLLKKLEEDPEQLRHMILGYANSVLLNNPASKITHRAYLLIVAFEGNFYDSKKAGLTRACYEVMSK